MKFCIYCQKKEPEITFTGREHVIPKFMGVFENNLVIKNQVCDHCNSVVFNGLETRFKEDTDEGVRFQMMNLGNSSQFRFRNENTKFSFISNMQEDFFNDIFPFFRFMDGAWKIVILPQIKIKKYGANGYIVLLVDEVKKINRNSKKFDSLKNIVKGAIGKDVRIFVRGDSTDTKDMDEAVTLVKELGIDYKEEKRFFAPNESANGEKKVEIDLNCTLNNDGGRVIAKIAFNYFAYCAIKGKMEDILGHDNFVKIRSYILGEINPPIKQIISEIKTKPVLYHEEVSGKRYPGHTLAFRAEGDRIIAEVSFLGRSIYVVELGKIPEELNSPDFGSGHFFDPIGHEIVQMSRNPAKWGTKITSTYKLFSLL